MGETDHEAVFVDGTKLESRAGRYTFAWRKSVEKHLTRVNGQVYKKTGVTTPACLQAHLEDLAVDIEFVYSNGRRKSERRRKLALRRERTASAPKDLAHRGLDDGTERLRTQLRDTAQRDKRGRYGGDQIEDAVANGARKVVRGGEQLIKKQ